MNRRQEFVNRIAQKIDYRKKKLKWCLENNKHQNADWNQKEIQRLEKLIEGEQPVDSIELKIQEVQNQIESIKLNDPNSPELAKLYGRIGHLRSMRHWQS